LSLCDGSLLVFSGRGCVVMMMMLAAQGTGVVSGRSGLMIEMPTHRKILSWSNITLSFAQKVGTWRDAECEIRRACDNEDIGVS
jgi:hypothetical protein